MIPLLLRALLDVSWNPAHPDDLLVATGASAPRPWPGTTDRQPEALRSTGH